MLDEETIKAMNLDILVQMGLINVDSEQENAIEK